jgi:hypothetical protein
MLEHKITYFKKSVDDVNAVGWISSCVQRAKFCINLYEQQKELGDQWLLHNLDTVMRTRHEYATHEESMAKLQLNDLLSPIVNQLKGA